MMGITDGDKTYESFEDWSRLHPEPEAITQVEVATLGELRAALAHLPDSTPCVDQTGELLLVSIGEVLTIS